MNRKVTEEVKNNHHHHHLHQIGHKKKKKKTMAEVRGQEPGKSPDLGKDKDKITSPACFRPSSPLLIHFSLGFLIQNKILREYE